MPIVQVMVRLPLPLPYIDEYVATTCRAPSFEAGYQQWLALVRAWHLEDASGCDREYYRWLCDHINDD